MKPYTTSDLPDQSPQGREQHKHQSSGSAGWQITMGFLLGLLPIISLFVYALLYPLFSHHPFTVELMASTFPRIFWIALVIVAVLALVGLLLKSKRLLGLSTLLSLLILSLLPFWALTSFLNVLSPPTTHIQEQPTVTPTSIISMLPGQTARDDTDHIALTFLSASREVQTYLTYIIVHVRIKNDSPIEQVLDASNFITISSKTGTSNPGTSPDDYMHNYHGVPLYSSTTGIHPIEPGTTFEGDIIFVFPAHDQPDQFLWVPEAGHTHYLWKLTF